MCFAVCLARIGAVASAFVLLLLLIFVLQNGQSVDVSFLGLHGHLPMGVALLLSAVVGVLVVALPGTARIVQLRAFGRRRPPVAEPSFETQPETQPEAQPETPSETQPAPNGTMDRS
jgi:uncharacterized integral membrane protein